MIEYPVILPAAGGGDRTATDLDLLAFRFPGAGQVSPQETLPDAKGGETPDPALGVGGEQKRRLKDRREDPLKQWKVSPIDTAALKQWGAYSRARNEMLARTHTTLAPWTLVRADDKRPARINLIRDLLSRLHYARKETRRIRPDRRIVHAYDSSSPQVTEP